MRRSLIRLLPLLLLILGISIPVGSALAAVCSIESEDCLFVASNATSDAPWGELVLLDTNFDAVEFFAPVRNYASSPNRLYSNGYGTTPYDSLGVKYVFDDVCSVTELYVTTSNPPGSNPARMVVGLYIGGSWTVFENRFQGAGAGEWTFSIDTAEVEAIGVQFVNPSPEIQSLSITGTCEGGGGPGAGLTFPLAGEDAHEQWGTYDLQYVQDNDPEIEDGVEISEYPNTVYSFSNKAEADVHAVADGTVISITPYSGLDCAYAALVFRSLRNCRVIIPAFITQETSYFVFNIELINLSIVVVEDAEDPDVTYTYWLADAEVSVGDEVVAGCVLGKTIQLKNPTNFVIPGLDLGAGLNLGSSGDAGLSVNIGGSIEFRSLLVDAGVTTVVAKVDGEPVQLYPLLSEEPDGANCAASVLTNCILDNAELKAARNGLIIDDWSTSGATAIDGGGVHIQNGGSITQFNIAILPDESYTMSVLARVTTPIDSFYPLRLEVGSASTTVNITEGDYQLMTWALGPREVSVLDHIGVYNQTNTPFNSEFPVEVDIKYICFAPLSANVAPGSCYFANHQFTADGQGWVSTGNVQFAGGQATMGDAAVIEQGVLLLPDGDTPVNYTVSALVRLSATNQFTGQSGKEIQMVYRFPETESYVELGLIDSVLVQAEGLNTYDGLVNVEHVYRLSATFEIAEGTEGLFSFGLLVTDPDYYLRGLRIDQLCLTPETDDGSFPGQGGGGGFTPPFIERCGIVPTPTDNNVSSWTYFHWKNLERFFNCTLMIKLNQMAETIDTAWKTTRLFMRWCVVLVNRVGDWMTTLLWWLGGHFRNIALGQVTTVYESGGGTCSDLFCVLEALITGLLTPIQSIVDALLSIVGGVVGLLLDIVSGLVSLLVALIIQLIGFLQLGQSLLGSVVTAYNSATPVAVAGIPQCSLDPRSSAFCMGIWILDNTIFSGTGAAIIPILVGILSIHLLLWVVGELKRTVTSVGGVT